MSTNRFLVGHTIARRCAPHLFSALIACALPVAILSGGRLLAIYLEKKTIHATAPRDFFIKNQGLALERAAACTSNVLLLYGSSELIDPVPNRASDFFSNAPTGFQVCPVGKAGTTSLVILQKIGALGSDLRDRKVAVSLSASWFFTHGVNPSAYAGNFSLPAASGLLFGDALDFELKAEIARRMSQFPDTLAKSALLQLAAKHLVSGRLSDRLVLTAIWPLGKLQNIVFDLQDHFETLVYILAGINRNSRVDSKLDSSAKTSREAAPQGVIIEPLAAPGSDPDAAFRARIAAAREWTDLELLFRTLNELGAKPLVLSMPIDVTRLRAQTISPSTRRVYYDKVTELARRYHVPLVQFEDHDADSSFLIARREHPTPKGWMYYDRALDDFFHNNQ